MLQNGRTEINFYSKTLYLVLTIKLQMSGLQNVLSDDPDFLNLKYFPGVTTWKELLIGLFIKAA